MMMKRKRLFCFKHMMAGVFFLAISIALSSPAFGQSSKEYADSEVATFVTDLEAGSYDIYILSTSGGIYDIDYPAIPKSCTIKAQDGLAEMPILKSSTSSTAIIRANGSSVRDTIMFENIEFDGTGSSPLIIRSDDETHLIFMGCYIHDAANSNGAIRMNEAGSSLDLQNTLFANCGQRMINAYTPGAVYGNINVSNCTFSGISGGDVLYFRSAGGEYSAGNDVSIDHCTFYDIGGRITRYQADSIHGIVSVTNSIFDQVNTDELKADIIDYNYLAGFATPPEGTNSIITAPVFADAANLIFTLVNKDDMTGGDFQILGDLTWYDDVYPPKVFDALIKVDQTHVMVQFNEMVDATTAADPANYTLSGTAGSSGNPSEAVLEASGKDVTLTVSDLSGMVIGQTVIVTVSSVEDLLGNVIADNNVATYTLLDETSPVVTMAVQAVTNDAGQVALAQSNEIGKIYLILDGVAQSTLEELMAALAAGKGSLADVVTADTDVSISTEGLGEGIYYAYAVDGFENISVKSLNGVTVSDITAPLLTMEAQEVPNNELGSVLAQSTETGTIYLVLDGEAQTGVADFETAIAAKKGSSAAAPGANADVSISAAGLEAGSYYGYAVDAAGNISAKSTNAVTVIEFVARVRYYEEADAETLSGDLTDAVNGDVFILTTSGGNYRFTSYANVSAKVTILAAEGLAERPVLSILRESNTVQTLRLYADGASITVKGIEFNSGSRDAGSWPEKYAIRTNPDIGNYSLTVEDCYFRGTWQANDGSNGAIVKLYNGTHADSIIFRNCIFEGDEGIVLNNSGTPFSWNKFEITNCTFMNIPEDQAILIIQRGENKNLPLTIDHCSFYGVGGVDEEVIRTDSLYNVNLTNSIFGTSAADTSWHLWGDVSNQSMVDYVNFFESPEPLTDQGGVLGTNKWTDDPQFADPANGDLTLGNQALYTLGSDGLPLGDLRWADIFGPKVVSTMTALSDSTLLIKFDEWIDTTTAIVATNYALSGSAGYTGTVKKAELNSFYSVLLTMESFISQAGNEIIVSVSNVEDLKGNVVDPLYNTSTYLVEEFTPVVTAEAQNVTNGVGEVVLAQSNQGTGSLYIILDGEPQSTLTELDAAVSAGKGAKAGVTVAYTDTEIDVYGIETGTYYAYAADSEGNLSEKGSNAIAVSDGIPPVVTNTVQSTGNGAGGVIVAQSNEMGKLYIILDGEAQETVNDFVSAIYIGKGSSEEVSVADTDVQISTADLVPGIYYAYAVDQAGNISVKGTLPLNITDATGIDNDLKDQMKIYSYDKRIVVETSGVGARYIIISDLLGRRIVNEQLTGDRNEFIMDHAGVYIIGFLDGSGLSRSVKLLVQ